MHYVYILHSPTADRFYIGSTSNLECRLTAHNHPKNRGWTKRFQPWTIAYSESFDSKEEALIREKALKSLKSKILIKKLISQGKTDQELKQNLQDTLDVVISNTHDTTS